MPADLPLPAALPAALSALDLIGLVLLILGWAGIGRLVEHPPAGRPSVSVLMARYRREWMRHFVTREGRIFDGNILSSLREGTAFFASASMIAIGGGLALISNADRMRGLARDFDIGQMAAALLEAKLVLTLCFVANALLKFVWAHRLFGYCAIIMASVPDDPGHAQAAARGEQAAVLNICAARHFNAGLRSIYFALGSLGWLMGGWGLIAGAVLVVGMTLRREFFSESWHALMRAPPPPLAAPGLSSDRASD